MSKNRVAIIGSGISGLLCAFSLCREGLSPDVYFGTGTSASEVALGFSSIKGIRFSDTPLFAAKVIGHFRLKSQIKMVERMAETKIMPVNGSVIEPYKDFRGYRRIQERVYRGFFSGLCEYENILGEKLKGENLGREIKGYLAYQRDFMFDQKKLLSSLKYLVKSLGGVFKEEKVCAINNDSSGKLILLTSSGKASYEKAIVAAGTGSSNFFPRSLLDRIRYREKKGALITVSCRDIASPKTMIFGKQKIYRLEKMMRFGAIDSGESEENDFLVRLWEDYYAIAKAYAIPAAIDRQKCRLDLASRALTRDRMPIIGSFGFEKRILYNTGMYKTGYPVAALVADNIGKLLKAERPEWPLEFFSPNRYLEAKENT